MRHGGNGVAITWKWRLIFLQKKSLQHFFRIPNTLNWYIFFHQMRTIIYYFQFRNEDNRPIDEQAWSVIFLTLDHIWHWLKKNYQAIINTSLTVQIYQGGNVICLEPLKMNYEESDCTNHLCTIDYRHEQLNFLKNKSKIINSMKK